MSRDLNLSAITPTAIVLIVSLAVVGVVSRPPQPTVTSNGLAGTTQLMPGQRHVNDTGDSIPEIVTVSGNTSRVHVGQGTTKSLTTQPGVYQLPVKWKHFCRITTEAYQSRFTQLTILTVISCHVTERFSGVWRLDDLRESIHDFLESTAVLDISKSKVGQANDAQNSSNRLQSYSNSDSKYNFGIDLYCSSNSNISLSWPMNARNLFKVVVKNCIIVNYSRDFMTTGTEKIPNSLRYMELSHCTEVESFNLTISNLKNGRLITRDFECGQDATLETYIYRNITKQLENITDAEYKYLVKISSKYMHDRKKIPYVCDFKHLLYYEETYNKAKSIYSGKLLTEKSYFDVLDTYNLSNNGISEFSDNEYKLFLNFPLLRTLDFSYNSISEIGEFVGSLDQQPSPSTTIDLQHNNISRITMKNIRMFQLLSDQLLIDIRNNPIDCNCSQSFMDVLVFIQESKTDFFKNGSFYSYLQQLTCASPKHLKGRRLETLSLGIDCPDITRYLIGPIIAVSVTCVLIIVACLILLKYRQEVTIFLFVRLNIIVPWHRKAEMDKRKLYDAFVSYSSNEEDWVEDFFENLEHSADDSALGAQNRTFKFCMHHRDFTAGKTIFDNVVKSVESSRHTIIILSKHYLNSEFCLYEFQQAFQQSIMEQKRHLVIVMCGDIPHEELPRDLKRCIKTFTYIRKDDFMFRSRLVFTLSVRQQEQAVKESTSRRKHLIGSTKLKSNSARKSDASATHLLSNGVNHKPHSTNTNHVISL